MRILYALPGYPPRQNGGTEWETSRRARWLAAAGQAVSVVAVDRAAPDVDDAVAVETDVVDGVVVRRVSTRRSTDWSDGAEYDDPVMYDAVSDAIAAEQPAVVHVLSGHRITTAAIRAAADRRVPVVVSAMDFWLLCPRITLQRGTGELCGWPEDPLECVTCLANDWRRYRVPHQLTRGVSSRALRGAWRRGALRSERAAAIQAMVTGRRAAVPAALARASRVIVASRFVAGMLAQRVVAADQLVIMRQGLDVADWLPADEVSRRSIHIGFIGQIAEHKGLFDLVAAFQRLAAERDDVRLFVHGDVDGAWPANHARLLHLVRGRADTVLAGRFDNRAVRQVHANLDVLVVPSRWYENSPNVILEAFACGTPVIASDLGGMAELVQDGVNGLLFPVGDVAALAACLGRFVDEPGLAAHLAKGIPAVRTIDEEMAELTAVYADVVAKG